MAGIGFNNALNYKAFPGGNIGRQVAFYHVRFADMSDGGALDGNNFRTALQVIQEGCELMWASTPYVSEGYGAIQVMVANDTANVYPSNGNADDIQQRLRNALDDGNIVFRREYLVGSNFFDSVGFFEYCEGKFAIKTIDGVDVPQVFTGPEQDEFTVNYINWYND